MEDGPVELDEASQTVTMFARRALDTGDWAEDYVFQVDTEFSLGFSFNSYAGLISPYTPHDFSD